MKLGLTSDAPGTKWCKMDEIENELYNYEKEVICKYKDKFPFKLWICFRCLPREYERKSMRRFYKQDNALGIDISIDEELMRPFIDGEFYPLSKVDQRFLMGKEFHPFFVDTIKKYKNKLPGLKEYGDQFVRDTVEWLKDNSWLKDDKNNLKLSIIETVSSYQRAMELFGNPTQKGFSENEQGQIVQSLVWQVEEDNVLAAKYILVDKNWLLHSYSVDDNETDKHYNVD